MAGGIVLFVNLWLCFVKNMKCHNLCFLFVLLTYITSISSLYKLVFDLVQTSCQPTAKPIEAYC